MNPQHFSVVEMQHNRAEYAYIHNGKEGISTAFEIKDNAQIKLNIPRAIGTTDVCLEVYCENAQYKLFEIVGQWNNIEGEYDSYIFDIESKKIGSGLYFIRPRLSHFAGELYGHRWQGSIYFDEKSDMTNMLQLTICDPKHKEAKKIRGGVIYHIFVDRFNRGGSYTVPDGARLLRSDWKVIPEYPEYPGAPLYNNTFWGGTLWGIIEKLDYIKSLGTTAIYLSPVFQAASNHKYDTADYMTVDPIFGGERALKALIKTAKEREIEIILDGVFNHTGSDSIYFNRYSRYKETGAYQSKRSKYFSWFDFQQHPTKYTSWWGIDILPRINPDNPDCCNYFVGEGGVIEKYANMGIYGFRLDVADELSDNFIAKIKSKLAGTAKDRILYGEVWEDASNKSSYGRRRHYYLGSELDGVMNYPLRTGILNYLLGKGTDSLYYAMTDVTNNAPKHILHNQMNLLGTHDTERVITVLADVDTTGMSNYQLARLRMDGGRRNIATKRLLCAYTILATMPGIPAVFYGDEAGLEGYRDPFNRMPYPWGKEDHRLIEHYQAMGRIRSENPVYKAGDYKLCHLDKDLLVFARYDDDNSFVTIVNNSDEDMNISFSEGATELISGTEGKCFMLSPVSAYVFKVSKDATLELI